MPQGRIILKSICQSKKLSQLKSDGARLLYTWLLPNLDIQGCFSGDEYVIMGQIFTRLKKAPDEVTGFLQDLHDCGLIIWYEADDDKFLHVPDFVTKQPRLNPIKEAKSTIPMPTPDLLPTNSRPTPDLLPPKQSEAKESKAKESKVKAKDVSFESKDSCSSVASLELNFYDGACEIFKIKKPADHTTLRNVAEFLGKKYEFDDKIFKKVQKVAIESVGGNVPIALFMSRMKSEFDYRKPE